MKRLLAPLMLVLLATGCGATPSADQQPTSAATETPTPTPTATVSQFASIIAEHEQSWRDYEDQIVECAFAAVGNSALDQVKRTTCSYTVSTVTLNAQTALREILRLPAPPSEVKDLVDRTIAALEPLGGNQSPVACEDHLSEACDNAIAKANGDIRPVTSVLDAWKPYL